MIAAALDLGSTRIKGALLDDAGALRIVTDRPAPENRVGGLMCESDPSEWAFAADAALAQLSRAAGAGAALGLASQRSSFLLWRTADGVPLTPVISWQDRRAAAWCAMNASRHENLAECGLPLSPHYAGGKLARLLDASPAWRVGLRDRSIRFGTLECWLLWRWSAGAVHETDLTMAARTLLADPLTGDWSGERLDFFGVPRGGLPAITPGEGRAHALPGGLTLRAHLADQAAALLALCGADDLLANLGTGAFVLRPSGTEFRPLPHYLAGPARGGAEPLFAYEGPVNGGAALLEALPDDGSPWPATDPAPDAFCIPDSSGLGAPHWRPALGATFSPAAAALPPAQRRRVALEGLLFRIAEIARDLHAAAPAKRALLAGGLARDARVAGGLAALLPLPLHLAPVGEATLLGAARLAAGLPLPAPFDAEPAAAGSGNYLAEKFTRWRAWLATQPG